ncbi:MAG: xanthine dehydrogenase molybdopterin binding subunit, partial [Burkholderiales bacterium PBB5]
MRERLAALAAAQWQVPPDTLQFVDDHVCAGARRIAFDALVALAYQARVQLWSDGFYATPGLHWDRNTLQGKPFYYFAYGAACAEVLVDTLTGEHKLLRADVLHDVGTSLNPAIDIGQIEGAFIQGMGWLTSEELWWQPMDGSRHAGKLMTHAPSTYKIPTANDVPAHFQVQLYGQAN